MAPHILMSGPIRPSESAVVEVIESIRSQFPGCQIFLSTWTDSELVRSKVDHYQAIPEPADRDILHSVHSRTIQQLELKLSDNTPGCALSLYKMMFGVQNVCALAQPHIRDTDKVVRIRTDSMFIFEPAYLAELLASGDDDYIAKKGDGFDWIAITSFATLKKTWCFQDIKEYNQEVNLSWNPENLVARRIPVPVRFLDANRVDMYILRKNGYKHYYP